MEVNKKKNLNFFFVLLLKYNKTVFITNINLN